MAARAPRAASLRGGQFLRHASRRAVSTGAPPRWVGYLGVLGVLGGVLAVQFLPLVLVVVWAIGTGIAGLSGRHATVARADLSAAPAV